MREMALPIIKNKESALRVEVQRRKANLQKSMEDFQQELATIDSFKPLWPQFDFELLAISSIDIEIKKIAGVRIPLYEEVHFKIKDTNWHQCPVWFPDAIIKLQELTRLQVKTKVLEEQIRILEHERKRTTQKVNLYEKVQIPEIQTGIKKIKRFLEDQENLSKAAQKMVKSRTVAGA